MTTLNELREMATAQLEGLLRFWKREVGFAITYNWPAREHAKAGNMVKKIKKVLAEKETARPFAADVFKNSIDAAIG